MTVASLAQQSVPSAAAAEPALAALQAGDEIAARVAAITEAGLARLLTAFGALEIPAWDGLAAGASVRLVVETAGPQPTLRPMADPAGAPSGAARASLPLPVAVTLAVREEAGQPGRIEAGVECSADPAVALAGAVARAAGRQQAPPELLSTLRALLANPQAAAASLPAAAQPLLRALLSSGLDAAAPIDAPTVQALVRQSGVFLDSRLAAGDGAPPRDAKALLLALGAILAKVASPPQAAATPPPEPAAVGPQAAPPLALPAAPAAAASDVRPVPGAPEPARDPAGPALRDPAGENQPSDPRGIPRSPVGDARLLVTALKAALGQGLGPARETASGPSDPPDPASPSRQQGASEPRAGQAGGRASLPRTDAAPRSEPAVPLADLGDRSPDEVARTLHGQVEAALDRIRLSQAAALPRDNARPTDGAPGRPAPNPAWVMDVPVLLPRETANAQLRIAREGGGSGQAGASDGRWSIEFAIETSEAGPVHARLTLGGTRLGVTLWAERSQTLASLRVGADALKRALDEAAFDTSEIAVVAGAPRRPAPTAGVLLDQRS
ncbi:flagellar hook-length control protein FliK [Alsobacter sp. KACC 23698]|uniref:Flagellar hook-length control protein FliK n=1 Tax=Alsobacter sp. KACC 23698 TaxID=3149229 RepID=A0AAU7JK43_9HYPH